MATWPGSARSSPGYPARARIVITDRGVPVAMLVPPHQPRTLPLVTLDYRLRDAALREGFAVLPEPLAE